MITTQLMSLVGSVQPPCQSASQLTYTPGATPRKLSHEEAGKIAARGWDIFVNVDGENCRKICPLPHSQLGNILIDRNEVERYDKISCRERYDAIKHLLTAEEAGVLMALLLHISGGTMENSSLWDMIRSHALMSYNSDNFGPIWTTFKLREGQSELAYRIFQDSVDHGLQYAFKTPIHGINQRSNGQSQLVEVVTVPGAIHRARHVVSTIPLNVLRTIDFHPPLSAKRQEAIEIGHVNFMTKIHAEVEGSGLASWNGMKFPNLLMFGYGDGVTENGNAHIVGFGKDERSTYVPEHHPEKTIRAFQNLHPMTVKKMVSLSPNQRGNTISQQTSRYSITGLRTPGLGVGRLGGRQSICQNIKMNCRALMAMFTLRRQIGPTDGARQSMVHWSKARSPRTRSLQKSENRHSLVSFLVFSHQIQISSVYRLLRLIIYTVYLIFRQYL